MDILVKHGSTDITSRVISYQREGNICTGVGTLTLILEGTYSTSISPHDTFSIYENGDFKVKYYVSNVSHNIPEQTITLECQDKSKYLVDYFIPQSYNIDYPSYTRTWIEQFLTEAGISYNFTTSSPGNLISNYTQLGLTSAYDQVMQLLQMSGWYMYFDGNGVAIIGTLDTDLASEGGSVGKTDILDIKKVTDDKMLRNRAVVWGEYDPYTSQYAFADVSVNTRWSYDRNDKRAVVISNSNIPDRKSAYGIANQLIKEFAKATIEKHITVWGARDYNLGETLRVDSHVWRGKGLITTFGVSMDRNGLVTNIILDQRCPRLFGFFNFGDYVYVSTYGEGVWRKHIKFDPTWYNFSTGLTDLNITDLHINNGIFGSVGTAGEMYYANDEAGSWHQVSVSGLDSSIEDTASGVITYQTFSGIYAHATIVDKSSNNVKFGVDTWSGLNMGDYFMNYSGWVTPMSGVSISGGHRGWILECDPYTGGLIGGLGSGIYPISISGNYNITVLDLENDGYNDYVSVATIGSGTFIPYSNGAFNYGEHTSIAAGGNYAEDSRAFVSLSTTDTYELEGETASTSTPVAPVGVFNNESANERDIVCMQTGPLAFIRRRFTIAFNPTFGHNEVTVSTTTSPTITSYAPSAVEKVGTDTYRFYRISTSQDASNRYVTIDYKEWDANANTVGGTVTVDTMAVPRDTAKEAAFTSLTDATFCVFDNKIWYYRLMLGHASSLSDNTNYIRFYLLRVNMTTGTSEFSGLIGDINFHNRTATDIWDIGTLRGGFPPTTWLHQNGSTPSIAIFMKETKTVAGNFLEQDNWLVHSDIGTDFELVLIDTINNHTDPDFVYTGTEEFAQLTGTGRMLWTWQSSNGNGYIYNGSVIDFMHYNLLSDIPFQMRSANIKPAYGTNDNKYFATSATDTWWFCNPSTLQVITSITITPDYDNFRPFATSGSVTELYFASVRNVNTTYHEIIRINPNGNIHSSIKPFNDGANGFPTSSYSIGNFFIGGTKALYINNANEVPTGGSYLVLRREGLDYTIIEQEGYPIRVDISNNAPLLDVGSGDSSFVSNFVTTNELTQVLPAGILNPIQVNDYRYTLLEPTISGITQSGIALQSTGLFIYGSGIFGFDTTSYSGGFTQIFDVPSGFGSRIETTNYGLGGQYIFITTSGDVQQFFQKDPGGFGIFTLYSGMPQSRATMIRIDDRV